MLADDGVRLDAVVRTDEPTTLALAEVDETASPRYRFYERGTSAPGLTPEAALAALPRRGRRSCTSARWASRSSRWRPPSRRSSSGSPAARWSSSTRTVRPWVDRRRRHATARACGACWRAAHVVKVSEEDLAWLEPQRSAAAAARMLLEAGPRVVLLTRGGDGVQVVTGAGDVPVPAPAVEVVDTIGAGDAFGGGFLAWWRSQGLGREELGRPGRRRRGGRASAPSSPRGRVERARRLAARSCSRARATAAAAAAPARVPAATRSPLRRAAGTGGRIVAGDDAQAPSAPTTSSARSGRGGMGVVYLATDRRLGRRVALKVIVPELAADPQFRQRFEREARVAATLEHPHVVPVYEAGEQDGSLFIAMRFIDGRDLATEVRDHGRARARSPRPRSSLQVAGALDAAHRSGVVHRDVKPANVLLTGAGDDEQAYLTDFGLTREAASESGLTLTGQWVGTVDYAAPEQILGEPTDARSDVYALGCLAFQALTGKPPFQGAPAARLFAHMNEPPPSACAARPELRPEVDATLARAMAKKPADRFQSAGDLGRALAAALAGRGAGRARAHGRRGAGADRRPGDPSGRPTADADPSHGRGARDAAPSAGRRAAARRPETTPLVRLARRRRRRRRRPPAPASRGSSPRSRSCSSSPPRP